MTDPNEKQLLEGLIESGYTDEEICAALGLSEEEYYNILNE
ncbi:DNA-directed RNA polymerase specialized sigma subunit [Scopulibacillus daqui]|uniref:DNA-directed RNA polymerase specialized sigma subunit n=1 Tax=Scopulibacillus daqui TaxID=1469162 RepID=A0ABS2PWN2_9BACL|nr:DNA-directed RNA polymerase specialized sigma subunit [Scopulibacillus daqui]